MVCCLYCAKGVDYVISKTPRTFITRGIKVEYEELRAHCPICKRELYIPELHDENCINREKAYKKTVEGEK